MKRVKSGCVTCRIRRVKCDEEKPRCRRCLSTGRKCDGYSTLSFSRRELESATATTGVVELAVKTGVIPRMFSDPAFADIREKRYFQFFRLQTVASTNDLIDCRFWDRVVLQLCHSTPAIKHAVLALGSLHQSYSVQENIADAYQYRIHADIQYHKALQEARTLISSSSSQDIDRVLIANVIFIIYEGVRGNYKASQAHMDSGRAILTQHRHRIQQKSRRNDLNEIIEALARLDVLAVTFSDQSANYHYDLESFYQTSPNLRPVDFRDLGQARASLIDLIRWLLVIGHHVDDQMKAGDQAGLAELALVKVECELQLKEWHQHFEELTAREGSESSALAINLRVWYKTMALLAEAESAGPETRYDAVQSQFEEVIGLIEILSSRTAQSQDTLSFSLDIGFIIPAFFAATRCRDPILRRRAIQVLQAHPRQEGMWHSAGAAAIAARWIEVEEEGLGSVTSAADIPSEKRIAIIETEVDIEADVANVRLVTTRREDRSEATWDETVKWRPSMRMTVSPTP